MDQQIKEDIELLINVARHEIASADKQGNHNLFTDVSLKYGHIAHKVYLGLDMPHRDCAKYHDKATRRVLLDPWTVFNRAKTFGIRNTDITPDNLEFWNHADMIKSLTDYLLQNCLHEKDYASA